MPANVPFRPKGTASPRRAPLTPPGCLAAILLLPLSAWPLERLPSDPAPILPPPLVRTVDFAQEIRPLLEAHCVSCHGPDKQKGDLRLDRRAGAFRGGAELGPAIVPGQSAQSPLVRTVAGLEPDYLMPQRGDRLSADAVAVLRAWIDQGADWPEEAPVPPAPPHWAFQPVQRPIPPAAPDPRWGHNPIDAFIVHRLSEQGLAPSPEADRRTLIRRLSLDLTGLLPGPAEVEAFVGDPSRDAYTQLVDRLLGSHRFGERWARHWLDAVRFAETHGFEMNQPRPQAWPYRDYVIRAFNEDLPYDRFVAEQLAGDALGADEATGFLVAGPWDQVKSPDEVLTRNQRADELHDMVNTVGTAFLGLTLGCARCHEHKFDPVPQRDYYAVKATLAGVQHGERPWKSAEAAARREEAANVRRSLATLEAELASFEVLASTEPAPPARRPPVSAVENSERFAPVTARRVRFVIAMTSGAEPCLDELEVYTAGPQPENVALPAAGTRAAASGTYPNNPFHQLEHLNDGHYGNSRSWISDTPGRGWVELEFSRPFTIDRVVWGRDRVGQFRDRLPTAYRIEVATEANAWFLVASSRDRWPLRESAPADPLLGLAASDPAGRTRLLSLVRERAALRQRLQELSREPVVYAGDLKPPEPTHRFHRGDPMQPREAVSPGALSQLGQEVPFEPLAPDAPDAVRRLALARWITHPAHPLTARVIVNRLWQHHFGEGLVATPSDFGVNGARPSHPELLDWLASELVAHGWSLKHIHRLIVTSATYRQSSAARPEGLDRDAGARWLWRFPPRRVEAEALRDNILAVSGNLDLRPGGPGFSLFEPNDNYVRVYAPRQRFGPTEWRRMIYATQVRQRLDGVFGAFDCPDGGQVAPRRNRSTTPLQALNLLNSGFVVEQAARFADRLQAEAGPDLATQIRHAFALAFSRSPDPIELEAATGFVREQGLAALGRVLFNANEFLQLE